jgi:hypothetical protein
MTNQQIAQTIIEQIGRAAFAMMGAKNAMAIERGVQFAIGRNTKRVNRVRVTLGWDDTYTMEFWKVGTMKTNMGRQIAATKIAETDGVYADNLNHVIESHTGLYLSL